MKTTMINNIKLIVLGLIMVMGLRTVHATTWTAPTGVAPANNTDFPVHQGGSPYAGDEQIKIGGLSVTTFLALMNAEFDQNLIFQGVVHGGAPGANTSTVMLGGTDYTSPTPGLHNVDVIVTGGLGTQKTLHSSTLAHPSQPGLIPVCAEANTGYLILCP